MTTAPDILKERKRERERARRLNAGAIRRKGSIEDQDQISRLSEARSRSEAIPAAKEIVRKLLTKSPNAVDQGQRP